jgi:hypothetical protein
VGDALGDGRDVQTEPDLDMQGDDQLAGLLRDGDALRRLPVRRALRTTLSAGA